MTDGLDLHVPDGLDDAELRAELDRIAQLPLAERAAAYAELQARLNAALDGDA